MLICRSQIFCQNVHFPYPTTVTGNILHPNHPQKYTYISCPNPRNPLIYRPFLSSRTTVSTCNPCGNISHPLTFSTSYPFSARYFISLAKVAESQLTYTTLLGAIFTIVSKHASSQPFLGGSTTITSAYT